METIGKSTMVDPASSAKDKNDKRGCPDPLQLILIQSSLLQNVFQQLHEKARSERYFRRLYEKEAAKSKKSTHNTIAPQTAHDIRASINAILGYSQVLKDTLHEHQSVNPDQTTHYVEHIISRCWRLLNLINIAFRPVPIHSESGGDYPGQEGDMIIDGHLFALSKASKTDNCMNMIEVRLDYDLEKHGQLLEALKKAEQRYRSISRAMIVREIDEFGNDIVRIGGAFKSEAIIKWGQMLKGHAAKFNNDKIQQMMQWFPEIVQSVEKQWPGQAVIRLVE